MPSHIPRAEHRAWPWPTPPMDMGLTVVGSPAGSGVPLGLDVSYTPKPAPSLGNVRIQLQNSHGTSETSFSVNKRIHTSSVPFTQKSHPLLPGACVFPEPCVASEAGLPLTSPCICFFPKPKKRPCTLQGHNRHVSCCLPHRVQMGVLLRLLGCPLRI